MNKFIFWGGFAIISVSLWLLVSNILAPFVTAFIISYILQPLIECTCNRLNFSRTTMSLLVFLVFISLFIIAFVLLIPIIYQQISILITKIPAYKEYLQSTLVPTITKKIHVFDPNIADKMRSSLQSFINVAFSLISGVFNNLWQYTLATINIFMLFILVPIILFYFLRDWPNMKNSIEELLPLKSKNNIVEIISSINNLLSAYIRGQLNICIILSCYYGIGLTIIGVDLGLLIGVLSGFLIIIPFIGTLVSFLLAIITGYFAFGFGMSLGFIVLLYIVGYLMENYFLTPKIIGDRIGLHPVWIIFAVFACGSVFGFLGIFFAIPIAGIIKVLLTNTIKWYKTSSFYKS